jgi:hemoglobin-like flavoprotein
MPKKIQNTTKAHLVSVPLPNHAASYTVISHQFVIDYAYQSLAAAGFGIVDEEYRCTADGQIAQGIYKLNFNNDPELSMMFAWTNSYNKQVKFKCVVGAYINNSGSVMISGEVGSWVRKHTGSADTETKDTIDQYISNANMYYNQLCSDKAAMEVVSLNKRKQSQLLGVLFAEYEILTTEQASLIRDQMKRPQQVFANSDSLWAFYNFVTNALQSSHPKTWMEDQRILHYFIGTICDFSAPPQSVSAPVPDLSAPVVDPLYEDPNQTNILDQIAEVTGDESVLAALYPLAAEQAFQNIKEVTEQALKDELMFGVSGVAVSAEGVRNVPIDEVLEKMQESDNQVVQEEVEIDTVLHQSEEIILDTNEAEEELSDEFVAVAEPEDYVTVEEYTTTIDQVVTYLDPAGNTFEAPVVAPCAAHDAETEREIEKENLEDIFPQEEPEYDSSGFTLEDRVIETIELNETTVAAVIVTEATEDLDEDVFAEADNFDLDFTDDAEENPDSIPDFF